MADTWPYFSVVIASSNRRKNLELVLHSLEAQSWKSFDVVVVDDGSTDGTRALIEELRSSRAWSRERLRWVSTGLVPRGLSRARNIGVGNRHAAAKAVVTLDADVVLAPDALDRLGQSLRGHPSAVAFGVVHWLPAEARGAVEAAVKRRDAAILHELVPEGTASRVHGTVVGPDVRPPSLFEPADRAQPVAVDPAFALNTFCAIPTSALDAVDGWDEHLVGYGYEDMEFGVHLKREGILALYVADAVGFHLWHPRDWALAALEAERNLDYILRRHGADAISDAYADWRVWWHYHRDRGGAVWKVDGRQFAVNRAQSHGLLLEQSTWLSRLGHDPAEVAIVSETELERIEVVGSARELPAARVPHVEAFGQTT
jgi:glycosyltransferase involved in cell wall biosynthesis